MDYIQAKLKKVLEKILLLMFWACGSAPVYSHVSACCELFCASSLVANAVSALLLLSGDLLKLQVDKFKGKTKEALE